MLKIVLDEVFGEGNYINEIVWHKGREGGSSRSHSPSSSMPTEYQNIVVYSKIRKQRFWNPILGPYKESTIKNISEMKLDGIIREEEWEEPLLNGNLKLGGIKIICPQRTE